MNKLLRRGVVGILINSRNQILICKNSKTGSWQFPQGGVDDGEIPFSALARELMEEIGVDVFDTNVLLLAQTDYIAYLLPKHFLDTKPEKFLGCVGQKHKYFLLLWDGEISQLNFSVAEEFSEAKWVDLTSEIGEYFSRVKRSAYLQAINELLIEATKDYD